MRASDPDERIRCWTEAIRLNPDDALVYYDRGTVCDDKGDDDGAVKDCTEAIRLKPVDADAYHS